MLCLHRVMDQLIEARAAQQIASAQLSERSGAIGQLAADRALALEKLCAAEEKLVALEARLQGKDAALQTMLSSASQGSGLSPEQLAELQHALLDANAMVSKQRGVVRQVSRSYGVGLEEPAAAGQLAELAREQQELLVVIERMRSSSSSEGAGGGQLILAGAGAHAPIADGTAAVDLALLMAKMHAMQVRGNACH